MGKRILFRAFSRTEKKRMTQFSVSVIIPAYNEDDLIGSCLESVLKTQYPILEVILVDDGSTDRTAEIAAKYGVTVVERASRGGISSARNEGIKIARGEIVAFVDADCIVDSEWLEHLTSHFTEPRVAGAGGLLLCKNQGLIAKFRSFKEREQWSEGTKCMKALFLPGGNGSYRSDIVRSLGGFDPRFAQPRGHEALELGHRIRKSGYILIGDPHALVWHLREGDVRSWIRTSFQSGYSAKAFLFRYQPLEFPAIQFKELGILAFVIILLLSALRLAPPFLSVILAGGLSTYLVLSSLYSTIEAAVHYRSPKYTLLLPIEIIVKASVLLGFTLGILTEPFLRVAHTLKRLLAASHRGTAIPDGTAPHDYKGIPNRIEKQA
jgi:glycosyltransferase involved in cell wall biosynthesis